ncbi:Alpha/Beta hydrolase protein [Ochromonadaceae sp. CCMP2298]|nr:Alpha/Beta hydrolase protein [Ochromonadaceae sp. CCMP2298]|mmetsp:Transcript_15624/g.34529  ORF Transcript_15624/g.34529 Transcript_15624/m.34529 type:complete len:339 (+) Transcript_15624:89-1105(+)|eukprot:CAMPEP_0173172304 /NCGR_PEP_ID=MMETSP1141-20130122/2236_1 /TAXON_ID=483371 /ORGANISM="non described non described, Strain CCMP2298" /LENGTH=338 /DNA_ID=CAMNT_0014094329 /DNA_START=13 /DNA_END=1032 /DNA_ORIENTATION=-
MAALPFVIAMALAIILLAMILHKKHAETGPGESVLPTITPKIFGLPLGPDVKVMVLLAGWPDNHGVWKHQIEEFQHEYHIVSISSPDHDRSALRKPWGYSLTEVPRMISNCVKTHLGDRKVDLLITHDWGALWGYYVLEQWSGVSGGTKRAVGRLVAVDIGASPHDDPSLPSDIDGVTLATPYSAPYQLLLASIFALGSGLSSPLAAFISHHSWPLEPLVSPMDPSFDWATEAPRPQAEVEWWFGYPYYYIWRNRAMDTIHYYTTYFGSPVPPPLFPKVPTLFLYGAKKRTMFHSEAFTDRLGATAGCRVQKYDAGHWLMYTEPARFNKDVRAFVAER